LDPSAFLLSPALPAFGGRVEVLKDYAGDLPQIVCDPALVREAFLNVILNALEAMRGEGVLSITTGRIASEGEAEEPVSRPPQHRSTKSPLPKERGAAVGPGAQSEREEFIYVIFVDTGPGVAAEDAERIFHLGYSTKPFGSGIGLYQARRAVAVHGGHIEVTPGGPGGAFTLYLPCRPRLSPSIEDLSPKARLPEDARELIIAPGSDWRAPVAAGEGELLL
jgi:two-component system NtrC family sensor kinase